MDRPASRLILGVCVAMAALAALASGAGALGRGDLATMPFVTVRGEEVDVLAAGTYRFNGLAIAAEGVGWDIVTLVVIVPAFLVSLVFLARGSLRATLAAMGMLAYFLYQYAEYAMYLAYGPLFIVYVATFSLSLCALVALGFRLDLATVAARVGDRFPRRGAIGLGAVMALLLAGMWLPLVARTFGATVVPELDGSTTLVVQAFDLGFLVPLGLATAWTVWHRMPIGLVLAAVVAIKALAMGTAIVAMLVVESLATGEPAIPPMIVFAAIAAWGTYLTWRILSGVGPIDRSITVGRRGQPGMAHPAGAD